MFCPERVDAVAAPGPGRLSWPVRSSPLLLLLLLPFVACSGDPDPVGDGPSPPVLEAVCSPTDNAQRRTCRVTVEPAQPVRLEVRRSDGTGTSRIRSSADERGEHEIGLYLLAPETDYGFTASTLAPDGPRASGTFTTGPLPFDPPGFAIEGTATVPWLGTHYPCFPNAVAVVFDTATGEVVWYQDLDPDGALGPLNMIRFPDDGTVLADTDGELVHVDPMGNTLLRLQQGVDFQGELHHDVFERAGRYYLLYKQDPTARITLDGFSVRDETGAELWAWDPYEHLTVPPDWATDNFTHTNTLFVDDSGDVYLSLWAQDAVLKIDGDPASPTFREIAWVLAGSELTAIGQDFVVDWSAVSGPDSWRNQHDVSIRDGRLYLFDNFHGRGLAMSLDEEGRTAVVDRKYPTAEPQCFAQGTTTPTSDGHVFAGCPTSALREYAPDGGAPVFQATLSCPNGAAPMATRWSVLEGW